MPTTNSPQSGTRMAVVWVVGAYAALAGVALMAPEARLSSAALVFVAVNCAISVMVILHGFGRGMQPLLVSLHALFFLSYILKAVVAAAYSLNSDYTFITIRKEVGLEEFITATLVVTGAHLLLAAGGVIAANVRWRAIKARPGLIYSVPFLAIVAAAIATWTVMSAVVMQQFGVAVMGTEGVSLPYGLSGILFYSRTIAIPFVLLALISQLHGRDLRGWRVLLIVLFVLLALSEVVVRATKAPFFSLILYLLVLRFSRTDEAPAERRTWLLLTALVVPALILYPVIEAYRFIVIFGQGGVGGLVGAIGGVAAAQDNGWAILGAPFIGIHNRLVGFTQLIGIVGEVDLGAGIGPFLRSGGIARFYTQDLLGLNIEGHLSSPSLLGMALIVGGWSLWPLVLAVCFAAVVLLWQAARLLATGSIAFRCILIEETCNALIAGTVELSLERLSMLTAVAVAWELFVKLAGGPVARRIPEGVDPVPQETHG